MIHSSAVDDVQLQRLNLEIARLLAVNQGLQEKLNAKDHQRGQQVAQVEPNDSVKRPRSSTSDGSPPVPLMATSKRPRSSTSDDSPAVPSMATSKRLRSSLSDGSSAVPSMSTKCAPLFQEAFLSSSSKHQLRSSNDCKSTEEDAKTKTFIIENYISDDERTMKHRVRCRCQGVRQLRLLDSQLYNLLGHCYRSRQLRASTLLLKQAQFEVRVGQMNASPIH